MTSTETSAAKARIHGADGVRALAALGVIFSHLYQRLSPQGQPGWYQDAQAVFMHGAMGVSTFFVLSGMLLAYPFWTAYLTGKPMPSLRHYARRRAARIVPAYYAALLVSFGLTFIIFPDAAYKAWRLVAGLTFTSGFHYKTFFPAATNGPLWSISLEVFSYVLLPVALAALFWWRRRRGAAPKPGSAGAGLAYWLVVIAAVTVVNGVIQSTFTLSAEGRGWQYGDIGGAKEWMPGYNPLSFFAHFAIGVLAALLIASRVTRTQAKAAAAGDDAPARASHWGYDLLAAAGLVGAGALVWFTRYPNEPSNLNWFQHQPYQWPVFALLIMTLLVGLAHSRWLWRVFDNRFFRYTATVSFGLYLWHFLLLHLFQSITDGRFQYYGITSTGQHVAISGALLAIAYGIATLSWRWIEKPALDSRWAREGGLPTRLRRRAARGPMDS